MTYEVELGGRTSTITVRAHPSGGYLVTVDGGPERHVHAGQLGAAEWWLSDTEGGRRTVAVHVRGDVVAAQVHGYGVVGSIIDPRDRALAGLGGHAEGVVRTPMPGAVARVLVAPGDAVHRGQVLVVVEAMKMENEFKSPVDGVVEQVGVTPGTAVEANTVLVVIAAGGGG